LLLPSPIPGEALEDGALSCSSGEFPYFNEVDLGEAHALGIRVEAVIGSVAGCSTYVPEESLPLSEGTAYVWDVARDGSALGIAWRDAPCADGASVSLFPTERGYQLDIISTSDRCPGDVKRAKNAPYAVTLFLPYPIFASSIVKRDITYIDE
jgi:hypothetical protein